jgi:hypothetical protein
MLDSTEAIIIVVYNANAAAAAAADSVNSSGLVNVLSLQSSGQ